LDAIDKILGWPLLNIGNAQTTIGTLLAAILVVIATLFLGRVVRKAVRGFFLRLHEKDDHASEHASRVYSIVAQLFIWLIGFELTFHLLGIRLTTLFAAGGFLALGAGLAAKNIVENFLSGVIIRAEKSIQPGDLITVDDRWLVIKHIGVRTIKANSYDGQEVLIPNAMVTQAMISNLTRGNRMHRIQAIVGVSYESDLALVRKTLEDATEKLEWRSQAAQPEVLLKEFGGSSVNYSVEVWIDDAIDTRHRNSDLHETVWRALKDKGILIAYPQLDVHLDQNVIDAVAKRNS
jgi:small-conductance mechanosensitive channel